MAAGAVALPPPPLKITVTWPKSFTCASPEVKRYVGPTTFRPQRQFPAINRSGQGSQKKSQILLQPPGLRGRDEDSHWLIFMNRRIPSCSTFSALKHDFVEPFIFFNQFQSKENLMATSCIAGSGWMKRVCNPNAILHVADFCMEVCRLGICQSLHGAAAFRYRCTSVGKRGE